MPSTLARRTLSAGSATSRSPPKRRRPKPPQPHEKYPRAPHYGGVHRFPERPEAQARRRHSRRAARHTAESTSPRSGARIRFKHKHNRPSSTAARMPRVGHGVTRLPRWLDGRASSIPQQKQLGRFQRSEQQMCYARQASQCRRRSPRGRSTTATTTTCWRNGTAHGHALCTARHRPCGLDPTHGSDECLPPAQKNISKPDHGMELMSHEHHGHLAFALLHEHHGCADCQDTCTHCSEFTIGHAMPRCSYGLRSYYDNGRHS